MARNVTDAAVLLGAGIGVDPSDAATAAQVGHAFTDYTPFLDADALEGARIGVWHSYDPAVADAATVAIFEDTVDTLESLGATVVDPLEIDFGTGFDNEFPALLCEFKTDIASYLETYTGAGYPKTLQDLIDFDLAHPSSRVPGTTTSSTSPRRPAVGDPDCAAAPGGHDAGRSRRRSTSDGGERPRRDRCADEQPGLGDRPGQRRQLRGLRLVVERRGGQRLRRHHGRRTGSSGRCRSACRSSAGAGPSRPSSAWPSPSSRRPRSGSRRSSSPTSDFDAASSARQPRNHGDRHRRTPRFGGSMAPAR